MRDLFRPISRLAWTTLFVCTTAAVGGCTAEVATEGSTATATQALVAPEATHGKAVIVWFYTGEDSKLTELAQSTVNFSQMYDNYDYKVFLAQDTTLGGIDLDAKAKKDADVWAEPTAENLQKYLKKATSRGYLIDLFIVAHGSTNSFVGSDGAGGTKRVTGRAIEAMPAASGYAYFPIRMVYQGQCYGETLNDTWRKVGAMSTAGARYVNFFPNQIGKFVDEWKNGKSLGTALDRADTASSRTVVHSYILADAALTREEWGGCPVFDTVLGDNDCSNRYFEDQWLGSDFSDRGDGKAVMEWSSDRIVAGSSGVTRSSAYRYSAP